MPTMVVSMAASGYASYKVFYMGICSLVEGRAKTIIHGMSQSYTLLGEYAGYLKLVSMFTMFP